MDETPGTEQLPNPGDVTHVFSVRSLQCESTDTFTTRYRVSLLENQTKVRVIWRGGRRVESTYCVTCEEGFFCNSLCIWCGHVELWFALKVTRQSRRCGFDLSRSPQRWNWLRVEGVGLYVYIHTQRRHPIAPLPCARVVFFWAVYNLSFLAQKSKPLSLCLEYGTGSQAEYCLWNDQSLRKCQDSRVLKLKYQLAFCSKPCRH